MIKFSEQNENKTQILVAGVGSAGLTVIDKINKKSTEGVYTVFIDTDPEAVEKSTAKEKFCISGRIARELEKDTSAIIGMQELSEELKPFLDILPKAEIVFTVTGLGGNSGTFVTPYLVQFLRERNHWVWALASVPFFFEGKSKILNSLKKLRSIQQSANTVMLIPHDKIFKMVDKNLTMKEAFTPANNLCADLILYLNRLTHNESSSIGIGLKFSDIKNKINNRKSTSFGMGEACGENRLRKAIETAVSNPLLGKEVISSSETLIACIIGDKSIKSKEIEEGMKYLNNYMPKDKERDVIFGAAIDPGLEDTVKAGLISVASTTNSYADNWDLSVSGENRAKENELPRNQGFLSRTSRIYKNPQQTMIDFKRSLKGRFEKSEATIYDGIDLDVPTFLRKKK